jgi:hypothetical protein
VIIFDVIPNMSGIVLNKLPQWKRPREYRSIVAFNPRGIYQVDSMHLYPLWDKIFSSQQKSNYKINDYALVCVDVYSRYATAMSMESETNFNIAKTMYYILVMIGKPQIISGDNQIINALYKQGQLYVEFEGIKFYRTSPNELNKNAIVERMIKTLKQYLLNIFFTYSIKRLYADYEKYKDKFESVYNIPLTFVDYLLHLACEVNNRKKHTTTKAVPYDTFNELETNKQKIVKRYYPMYKEGTIVMKQFERKGQIPNKVFNFDPEPYIVVGNVGRKFKLRKLIDYIEGKVYPITKNYQPYEIKPFNNDYQLLNYLKSELIKNSLIKLYNNARYESMVKWVESRIR